MVIDVRYKGMVMALSAAEDCSENEDGSVFLLSKTEPCIDLFLRPRIVVQDRNLAICGLTLDQSSEHTKGLEFGIFDTGAELIVRWGARLTRAH